MAQPGMPSARGEDALIRRIQQLERDMVELRAANIFGRTGITPKDGGTDFDGYVTVNGLIVVNGASTFNGPLVVNGGSTFNGAMAVTGTLSLPAGIIGNDALANPLTTGSAGMTASNQSFTTTPTQYGTELITVPAGFTRAVVMNGVSAGGTNSGAGGDYLYVAAGINGVPGGEMPSYANAGFYASGSAFGVRTLTGLTAGSSISVSVQVRTNSGAWAAAGANIVNVNALALFYR